MNTKQEQRGMFQIYLPEYDPTCLGNTRNRLIKINPLSFTHKEYPTCECGRKYVPRPSKAKCLKCVNNENI